MISTTATWAPPAACPGPLTSKGVIVIDNEEGELDEDTVMMDALEAGADDLRQTRATCSPIYTDPDVFNECAMPLWRPRAIPSVSAQIEMVPQNYIKLTSEQDIKNMDQAHRTAGRGR